MPYSVTKSIDVDFAHHVTGHPGACINIHGHTWKFEAELEADQLDEMGFVTDFGELKRGVLLPIHALLDHSLALWVETYQKLEKPLSEVGEALHATREGGPGVVGERTPGYAEANKRGDLFLCGAHNVYPGGIKVAVFPFAPTSEKLAQWFYDVLYEFADAAGRGDPHFRCRRVRVYETLHPVEAFAEYRPF